MSYHSPMAPLQEKDFKVIIARRDRRFDGRFYFGVKTTGIYCRPICPAKPKPENIVIFRSSSEAEGQGYRPCLRCHPDLAPAHRDQQSSSSVVSRALRLINGLTETELSIGPLAQSLAITDRHLRRLFDEELGASPIEVLITQRLHFAWQAVEETSRPITEIAFASGFQSIRQFNETFKRRFHRPPSAFRKEQKRVNDNRLHLRIPIRAPYDWATVLSYLTRHETYGLEEIRDGIYKRFVSFKKSFGTITVSPGSQPDFLAVEFQNVPLAQVRGLLARIKNLFDTDHNPLHLPITDGLDTKGIRVPGCFDPFETAVAIILGQLVSTEQAKAKLKTLVTRFGRKIDAQRPVYEFPSPQVLARAQIVKIGIPRVRAQAIRLLAQAIVKGHLDFQSRHDFPTIGKTLLAIKGIGPWTASMIAMRCLGDPDAFPEFDLIIQRAIEKKLVKHEDWASSRAYLTHCLWRDFSETLSKKRRPV